MPFVQRIVNADSYEQAVLKYMAQEGCDRVVSFLREILLVCVRARARRARSSDAYYLHSVVLAGTFPLLSPPSFLFDGGSSRRGWDPFDPFRTNGNYRKRERDTTVFFFLSCSVA